jgi:Fur family transcriptional regulator, stress-responsive regulator
VADGQRDIVRLREAGVRVTSTRLAVLATVRDGDHLPVDEITRRVRARLGSVSTQAVYDVLHALDRVVLFRRIQPAGSPARYEARVGDNHHHLVCRSCGLTVDVDCVTGAAPCLETPGAQGCAIDEAEVTFWGLCPSCQPEGGPV